MQEKERALPGCVLEPDAIDERERSALLKRLRTSWRRRGLDRRAFGRLVALGGVGSALAACAGDAPAGDPAGSPPSEQESRFFKDPGPFVLHGSGNLEARLETMGELITPNERFFVRNNSRSVAVDVDSYRLSVDGAGLERSLELSYDDLLEMPSRSVFAYIECGGNHRAFFDLVTGRTASGTQWRTGGISMAEWTGVPLAELLVRAGVRDNAVDVQLIGLDTDSPEQGFRRPLPIAKALDPDTLVAWRMNGVPLPPDHGFPVRAVVPGWVGSANIKWLGSIEVSTERIWSRNTTTSYVLIGDDYSPEGESEGAVITTQSIKSALALPWPARLPAGTHRLRGYAQSPHAPIAGVQWSDDDGLTWNESRLLEPLMRYSWARFEFDWDAGRGPRVLTTRAIDAAGNSQPDVLPFNEKGYLFNLPLPHPVTVS